MQTFPLFRYIGPPTTLTSFQFLILSIEIFEGKEQFTTLDFVNLVNHVDVLKWTGLHLVFIQATLNKGIYTSEI